MSTPSTRCRVVHDVTGSYIQWMYGEHGNREGYWRRREARGVTVDRELEAFEAGWRRGQADRRKK